MFILTGLGDVIVFVAGGALVWFFKDKLMLWYKGAEKFVQDAKAMADKVSSAVKK